MDHPRPPLPSGESPDDALESLLRRQVWAPPPASLRDRILTTAQIAQAAAGRHRSDTSACAPPPVNGHTASPERRVSPWTAWVERLHSGWTVLGAAWALVVALNLYSQNASGMRTAALPPLSEASLALLRTESRLASMNATAWDGLEPAAARSGIPPAARPPQAPGPGAPQREKPRARGPWEHLRGLGLA